MAERAWLARTIFQRIRGLLFAKPLDRGEALVIPSLAPQVHTFFMNYPIDVIFLNRDNCVVALEKLEPWRISRLYSKAVCAVELTQGAVAASQTQVGDKIEGFGSN